MKRLLREQPHENWSELAVRFKSDTKLTSEYWGRPFPRQVDHLTFGGAVDSPNFKTEMLWGAATSSAFAVELSQFSFLRRAYEVALAKSNRARALATLAEIESQFGVSLWLFDAYFSTYFEFRDESTAEALLQKLMSAVSIQLPGQSPSSNTRSRLPLSAGICIAFGLFKSFPIDSDVIASLLASFLEQLREAREPRAGQEYLRYRAGEWYSREPNIDQLALAMTYERKSAVIDRYVTLLKCAELGLAIGAPSVAATVSDALTQLKLIDDPVLTRLRNACRIDFKTPSDGALAEYVDGRLERSALMLLSRREEAGDPISAMDFMVAHIAGADPSLSGHHIVPTLSDRVLSSYMDVAARGDAVHRGREHLGIVMRRHSGLSFGGLIASRLGDDSLLIRSWNAPTFWGKLYFQYLPINDPQRLRYAPNWLFDSVNESELPPDSPQLLDFQLRTIRPVVPELIYRTYGSTEYATWNHACWLSIVGRLADAKPFLQALEDGTNRILSFRAAVLRCKIALDLGEHADFIRCALELLLKNPNCVKDLEWETYFAIFGREFGALDRRSRVRLAYLYCLYDRLVGFENALRIANVLEDVFDEWSVSSPEKIPEEAFDSAEHRIGFLLNVCVPKYLEGNSHYPDSGAVIGSRIRILEVVAVDSPQLVSRCMREIRRLREDELVSQCLRDFQSSMLFVSEDSIKKSYESIADQRLKALKARPKLTPEVITIFDNKTASKAGDLSGNVDALVLVQPYREFRDIYVRDKRFGLNTILNSRLRHGVVPNMLLRPIAERRLDVESVAGRLKAAGVAAPKAAVAVDVVGRLTKEYDLAVRKFSSESLRVRLVASDTGMFDFLADSTSSRALLHLKALGEAISERTTTADLLQVLSAQMREHLQLGANAVKSYLLGDFYQRTNQLFDKAATALKGLKTSETDDLRNRLIATKQACLVSIKAVAAWFEIGDERFVAPLDAATVMHAAYRAARETLGSGRLSADIDVETRKKVAHVCIRPLFQLTTILFENAVTHCGGHRTDVSLHVSQIDDSVLITSRSTCAEMDAEEYERKRANLAVHMARIKAKVDEFADQDKSSGLAKIIKLIRSDMTADVDVDVDYDTASSFRVHLVIKADQVLV